MERSYTMVDEEEKGLDVELQPAHHQLIPLNNQIGILSRIDAIPERSVNTDYRDDKTVGTAFKSFDIRSATNLEKKPLIQRDDPDILNVIQRISRLQQIKRLHQDESIDIIFGLKFNPTKKMK